MMLLIASVLSIGTTSAVEPANSPSPIASVKVDPVQQAKALFESGVEAFAIRKYSIATRDFERLLREHPTNPYRLESLFYLGQSLFHSGHFSDSVAPLQETISLAGRLPLANEARVILGNAYLELQKLTEAFLVSEELLQQKELRSTLRGKALLIRAQAQAGLKQSLESEKTLTVFQAVADSDPELERELARSFLFSLVVKGSDCDRLASDDLNEKALITEINQKGICLLEMGVLLSRSARVLKSEEIHEGSDLLMKTYRHYSEVCHSPPLKKGKLKKKAWLTARKELSAALKASCQSTFDLLLESLRERESASQVSQGIEAERKPGVTGAELPRPVEVKASPVPLPSPTPSSAPDSNSPPQQRH